MQMYQIWHLAYKTLTCMHRFLVVLQLLLHPFFLDHSVQVTNLSNSNDFCCAVTCLIAVKKDSGIIKPDNHVTLGISFGFSVHSLSCNDLFNISAIHKSNERMEGHDNFSHAPGTLPKYKLFSNASIPSDMVNSPAKPRLNSFNDFFM